MTLDSPKNIEITTARAGSLQRLVSRLVEFIGWWLWRRWRIYCPCRSVAHLFDQNRRLVMTPYGLMEFPGRDEFENVLFHYDEAFVTPCTFNETNCGGYRGRWTPKIGLLSMEMPEDG